MNLRSRVPGSLLTVLLTVLLFALLWVVVIVFYGLS